MFEGLAAQRSLALFVAGWLLLSFPLLGLWDADATVFGLPLFPLALFVGWALLIGALAWLAERGDDAGPGAAARHPADAAPFKPPEMAAPSSLRSRLAGRAGPVAQPFARHEEPTGLFMSGLSPRGALSRLGAARRSTEPPPTN